MHVELLGYEPLPKYHMMFNIKLQLICKKSLWWRGVLGSAAEGAQWGSGSGDGAGRV